MFSALIAMGMRSWPASETSGGGSCTRRPMSACASEIGPLLLRRFNVQPLAEHFSHAALTQVEADRSAVAKH